jgi:phage gp16-like protein
MSVNPGRRARLAKVHIAKKQLQMEDEGYRELLQRITGHGSSANCTDAQLDDLLQEFRRLGFEPKQEPPSPGAEKEYVRMIYALWSGLKPYLRDSSQVALRSFVKRMTGVDKADWLGPEEANDVIEGLKAWLARERDQKRPRHSAAPAKHNRRPGKTAH